MLFLCLRTKTYLSPQLLVYLPIIICTRSWPYLFIFILSFRLTVKIYPSTFPLFYMSTDVPVRFISYFSAYPTQWRFNSSTGVPTHRSTRKYIYLFTFMLLFRLTIKTYLSPQLLVYLLIFVPFMVLPVHFDTFIPINRLDRPVNVSTVLHVHRCTCSSLYLFSLFILFRHNMHNELSTHLWVPTRRSTRK